MGDNYKYNVISIKTSKEVDSHKQLLGNSLKDAEELLAEFSNYINKTAGIYAAYTNIDKGEFFGEAVIALGKAKSEFDLTKGGYFIPFAKFLILDAMNECVKSNRILVHIPSYIDKSHNIINRIKESIFKYTDDFDTVLIDPAFRKSILPKKINDSVYYDIVLLKRAAKRASITFKQLVNRALVLPTIVITEDNCESIEGDTSQDAIIAKMVVNKIKLLLDDDELTIAELIMEDKTKEEMGTILKHTNLWINNRIKAIRRKVKMMIIREEGGKK
jgi:hypothetical protein